MKKILLLLIVYSLYGKYSLDAQSSFGIRTGLSLSTMENNALLHQLNSTSASESALLAGLDIAGVGTIPFNEYLSLQVEAHFLQKGGKIRESFVLPNTGSQLVVEEFETAYRSSVLEFPVILKYRLINKGLMPNILLGGSYGRVISQKVDGDDLFFQTDDSIILLSG